MALKRYKRSTMRSTSEQYLAFVNVLCDTLTVIVFTVNSTSWKMELVCAKYRCWTANEFQIPFFKHQFLMAMISSYNFLFIKILNCILCYLLISRYVGLKNGILKFETCFDTINYLWHNHILITQCVTILQRQMVSSKDLLNAMVYKGLLHLS